MGRKLSLVDEAREKIEATLVKALTSAEVRELDTLIRIQLLGVEVVNQDLFSFGNKDIPLENGLVLRLFSNKPRALYLKGTHAYHAWLVNSETGETLHAIEVTKKPDTDARLSDESKKVDARRILEILRQFNNQILHAGESTR